MPHLDKELFPPANVKEDVTQVVTAPSDGSSKTRDTAALVTKDDVAQYRNEDLFLRVNPINNLEISLRAINNSHVVSFI